MVKRLKTNLNPKQQTRQVFNCLLVDVKRNDKPFYSRISAANGPAFRKMSPFVLTMIPDVSDRRFGNANLKAIKCDSCST